MLIGKLLGHSDGSVVSMGGAVLEVGPTVGRRAGLLLGVG